jgi:hypothetical protein
MASGISGQQILRVNYGLSVVRTAAVLPASTVAQNIFAVTGGRVIVTTLVAQVTTVMTATATNIAINLTPTSGAVSNLATATAVTSLAVSTNIGVAAIGSAGAVGSAISQNNEMIMSPGIISFTPDATNTGALKWIVTYVPLDPGAQVTAL